jgi:hypothetical protein
VTLTLDEALKQIEELGRNQNSAPVSQQEVLCPETQAAVRILAEAYSRLQKRDALYGDRRRAGALPPPPGRLLPG